MNITLKNLGPINEAELTLGDFTIVCGRNNSGKTYVTYALYGFLNYWQQYNDAGIDQKLLDDLTKRNLTNYPIDTLINQCKYLLKNSSAEYSKKIKSTFVGSNGSFADTEVRVTAESCASRTTPYVGAPYYTGGGQQMAIDVSAGDLQDTVDIILHTASGFVEQVDFYETCLALNEALKHWFYDTVIPKPFIVSAERTGAAIFQREVDFTRSKIIDLLKESSVNPHDLLSRFTADYPVPVKHNIDFIRDLPNIIKKESVFAKQHPEVLQVFSDILGGHYVVNQAGSVEYTPSNNPEISLSLSESSSTVRSLVNIGFYLRHTAQPGDLLMVDEPELNLHPQNQRKVARLFAMLVNYGIRVFITTHSDYMIRELNTLLLLNRPDDERLKEVMEREGYAHEELLEPEQLSIYMTIEDKNIQGAYTLIPAKVTEESGIELTTFDDTIDDMNRIQDEIIWG